MGNLNTTTIEKRRDQQRAAQERARARQLAKKRDPEWQARQRQKQAETRERQLAKLRDPAAIAARREKQAQRQADKRERDQLAIREPKRRASTRGLKGRTPTAEEQRYMDAIGQLPCICCHLSGRYNPVISLHHIDGRTKPGAHKRQLPLCQWHHDVPAEPEQVERYADLIPIHAKGSFGGKAAWERHFGDQNSVLAEVYRLAGLPVDNILSNDADLPC